MNARTLGLYFGYVCAALGLLLMLGCALKMLLCNHCSTFAVVLGDVLLMWGLHRVGWLH